VVEMDEYDGNVKGMITGISHGTTKDGPGWRSIIYFKGCNFHCRWCGSPETWSFERELLLYPEMEKYPERVAKSCPHGAITRAGEGTVTDRSICEKCECFECVDACIDGSRELAGREVTVDELVGEVSGYRQFHDEYGVTLTGGEVSCQWMFFLELLKGMKSRGIHTAAETNGSFDLLPGSLPWLDLAIIDLKHPDPVRHRNLTGYTNERTLENIAKLAEMRHPLWVRIPLVPGINDGEALDESAGLLQPFSEAIKVEILGYHRIGLPKWAALGKEYSFGRVEPPSESDLESARDVFRNRDFDVIVT